MIPMPMTPHHRIDTLQLHPSLNQDLMNPFLNLEAGNVLFYDTSTPWREVPPVLSRTKVKQDRLAQRMVSDEKSVIGNVDDRMTWQGRRDDAGSGGDNATCRVDDLDMDDRGGLGDVERRSGNWSYGSGLCHSCWSMQMRGNFKCGFGSSILIDFVM